MKILLIHGDVIMAGIFASKFEELNCEVTIADSYQEAVEKFENYRYDTIVINEDWNPHVQAQRLSLFFRDSLLNADPKPRVILLVYSGTPESGYWATETYIMDRVEEVLEKIVHQF